MGIYFRESIRIFIPWNKNKKTTQDAIDIIVKPFGQIVVTAKMNIHKPDGTIDVKEKVSFCGCGLSKNKPYCDASHKELLKDKV